MPPVLFGKNRKKNCCKNYTGTGFFFSPAKKKNQFHIPSLRHCEIHILTRHKLQLVLLFPKLLDLKNTVNLEPIHVKDKSQNELSFPNPICKKCGFGGKEENIFVVVLSLLPGEEKAV